MSTNPCVDLLFGAILLAFLSGCAPETSKGNSPAPTVKITVTNSENGIAKLEGANGVTVTIENSVRYYIKTSEMTGQPSLTVQKLNGIPFTFEGQLLKIGDWELQLADNDAVRLSAEGVFVNEERRADMPAE